MTLFQHFFFVAKKKILLLLSTFVIANLRNLNIIFSGPKEQLYRTTYVPTSMP